MTKKPDWMMPHGKPWTADAGRIVYDNPWVSVTEFKAVAPTGKSALYGLVGFKNQAIAVLPLHDDGTVTLVGQNRFPFGDYSWEIPEGGAPIGEAPLDGAKRELAEETGLTAGQWLPVLTMQLSNSITNEIAHGFLALELSEGRISPDETEDIAVVRVPFAQALHLATTGQIQDSLTVAMLLRAHHMAYRGELPRDLARLVLGEPGKPAEEL